VAGTLQLRVVTPERPLYEGEADAVVVPAHDGEIGILPRHARLLASLGIGELRARRGAEVRRFFVDGGFVQVRDNLVTVLCDRATRLEDTDLAAAEAAARTARETHAPDAARLQQRVVALRRVLSAHGSAPAAGH